MQSINNKTPSFVFNFFYKKHTKMDIALAAITLIGLIAIGLWFSGVLTPLFQWKNHKVVLFNSSKTASPESAKISQIKAKHANQLKDFETWGSNHQWNNIRHAHYDWWMFPLNHDSAAHGATYNVNLQEVETLKQDLAFMKDYKRGVSLVVRAWGWDLEKGEPIQNPVEGQHWDGYGVRLAKMSDSLQLFGEVDLHNKLKKFFVEHCLTLQEQTKISDLDWLHQTFHTTKMDKK